MAQKTKVCSFCECDNCPYCCPRCGRSYCSSKCYRHSDHVQCSEAFYKECIIESLKDTDGEDKSESKRKMHEILQRIREKEELDSDDEDDDVESAEEQVLTTLEMKLLNVNLEEADADINRIWKELTPEERREIESTLDKENISDLIPIWNPWWLSKNNTKLVRELDEEKPISPVPNIPKTIAPLASLTSVPPSPLIVYDLINILAVYVYTARRYNGDHQEIFEESAPFAVTISKSLLKNQNFTSVIEPFNSLKEQQIESNTSLSNEELVIIMDDVCCLLESKNNSKESTDFVIAALSDFLTLLKQFKTNLNNKGELQLLYLVNKKQLTMSIKKLEYLISWTTSVEIIVLSSIIPQIRFEITSLLEENFSFQATKEHIEQNPVKKATVLIQEIK